MHLVSFDRVRSVSIGVGIIQENRIGFRFRLELMDVGVLTSGRSVRVFTQDNGLELFQDGKPNFLRPRERKTNPQECRDQIRHCRLRRGYRANIPYAWGLSWRSNHIEQQQIQEVDSTGGRRLCLRWSSTTCQLWP